MTQEQHSVCKSSRQAKHFLQQEHPVGSMLSHSHLDTIEAQMASLHVVLHPTRCQKAAKKRMELRILSQFKGTTNVKRDNFRYLECTSCFGMSFILIFIYSIGSAPQCKEFFVSQEL